MQMAAEQGSQPRLKTALGFWQLLFYGVAFMVPIAPIVIYGVVTQVTGGHMAMAYLLAMIAMFFTAASYGQMAGEFPEAGSTYSYTRHGLNPHLGMLAGWTILLDYVLMPALSYVVIAIFGSQLLPSVPYWLWVAISLPSRLSTSSVADIGTTVVLILQVGVPPISSLWLFWHHPWRVKALHCALSSARTSPERSLRLTVSLF
jgi:amino acid transporter